MGTDTVEEAAAEPAPEAAAEPAPEAAAEPAPEPEEEKPYVYVPPLGDG